MVVFSQGSFSFEDLNGDCLLVVLIGCENLRFFSWNVRSFWDDLAHNSTDSFNTEGKRGGINDDQIFGCFLSADDSTLDGSTIADSLIRVDTCVGLFTIEVFLD